MRIQNKTHWLTADIQRLVKRVAQDELDPEHHKRIRVIVNYRRRSGGYLGHGCIGYSGINPIPKIWLHVERPGKQIDPVQLAHTIAHEFGHNMGLRHRQMNGTRRYGYADGWREHYAWATEWPIREKPVKVVLPTDRAAAQLQHATQMLARAATRMKRAQTISKRWQRRVVYYEKKLAALGSTKVKNVSTSTVDFA